MALVLADRVREGTNTAGTGTVTLTGAVTGFASFADQIGNGNTTYYTITDGTNWEVGVGTYNANTLSRDTVLDSSTGFLINFAAGFKDVFVTLPAEKVASTDTLGTMSTQNANAVAITGGAINGATVGATTPAAGTFTTLTAQTEVLKGTGQNILQYSQAIGGTNWSGIGTASVVLNSVVAPDSTTTASKITLASGDYYRQLTATNTLLSGVNYTFSCYVKASASGGASNVRLTSNNGSAWNTGFSTKFTLTSSWQRVSVTGTISGTSGYFIIGAIDGTGTNDATCAGSVDVWGAQLELGSTANTYIPTTTTAVYGTPTLSFSGVAGIGLQSDGSLYVQPAGTGAVQAQATTSTATGGNARGANAVDWQTARGGATQVASATSSTIGGGYGNLASGAYGVVAGGLGNTASGIGAATLGGSGVSSSGIYSAGLGGSSNTVSGYYGAVVGGQSNTAAGYYSFIGNGFTNSGTSGSAVTTQSGTMNGTTAVTLSGSNANIKVGQLITGTSIAVFTYVAAISGTSLTLSQVASGSSTSTLSFYTPHGVVVGGGNNQATGSYSFIGGGGDAGTAANRNVASGDWSFVGGGIKNTASGSGSVVVGGGSFGSGFAANTASATSSFVGAGYLNSASGFAGVIVGGTSNSQNNNAGFIGGGSNNTANSNNAVIAGGSYGTSRSVEGYAIFPAHNNPIASASGVSQGALIILGVQTTDATATVLRSNTSAASGTNQVILPNNSAYYFKGTVVAGVTGGGNTAAWAFEGTIKRGANAAATSLVGTPVLNLISQDSGASTWVLALTADTTNGGLAVTFTGQASTTIRAVCKVETTEMTY